MDGTNETGDKEPPIPPIDYKRALVLDKDTAIQPTNVTSQMAWQAIEKLELRQWVNEAKWEAQKQFGQYLEVELTQGVMTTDIFEAAQAMKRNIEGFSQMANSRDIKADARIAAGLAAASAARSFKELMDSLNRRIKEAQERKNPDLQPRGRRRGPPIRGPIEIQATELAPARSGGDNGESD